MTTKLCEACQQPCGSPTYIGVTVDPYTAQVVYTGPDDLIQIDGETAYPMKFIEHPFCSAACRTTGLAAITARNTALWRRGAIPPRKAINRQQYDAGERP